jgi:aldehyde dehydrogenase (NAD+)
MGSPFWFSKKVQVQTALEHFEQACGVLEAYEFEHMMGSTRIIREPFGVCGFITPWNWPVNQVASKLAPASAAGCTVVVKPSEMAPLSSIILAEVLHDAGVPRGVFNLVNGDGPTVGQAIAASGAGRKVGQYHPSRRRSNQGGAAGRDAPNWDL